MCQYCGNTGFCYLFFSAVAMKLFIVIKNRLMALKKRRENAIQKDISAG
jgi:hypothetical protein